jgi:hypothetical protein
MIVIARSGNNNIWHIVTVGLGERPVPQSYFSTRTKPSADTGKSLRLWKNAAAADFNRGKLAPDELHPEKRMQDPFRFEGAGLDYFFSITHCSGC